MFRFLHTADIHLDSPLKGLEVYEDAPVDEIRGATRRAFDNLVDLAIEEKVDFILIAGDLYDGDWKDYNTGLFFASRMGRLAREGIRVFIVSGNHDAASQITRSMPLPDNVTLLSPSKTQSVRLDDLGVIIHGRSYSSRAVTDNLASGYPQSDSDYFNIGLLHTSLTGHEGHEDYAPCSLDDLKSKGYEYWALGHIHKQEVVCKEPPVVFPGNIQGRHIKETGAKGALLVTVEDGQITRFEQRYLDVLRWAVCSVDLSDCDSPDTIYNLVLQGFELERGRSDGRPVALRLVLTGKCPVHAQLHDRTTDWTEKFRGIAAGLGDVWLEKVKFSTSRETKPGELFSEDTAVAGLLQAIQHIQLDGESLSRLVPELAALKSKLPAEIHSGDDPFLDPAPGRITELRAEVQELLIAKLLLQRGLK